MNKEDLVDASSFGNFSTSRIILVPVMGPRPDVTVTKPTTSCRDSATIVSLTSRQKAASKKRLGNLLKKNDNSG